MLIHACVQTLLIVKRNREVDKAAGQSHLRQLAVSRVQNSAMFPHFCARAMCNYHVSWEGCIADGALS